MAGIIIKKNNKKEDSYLTLQDTTKSDIDSRISKLAEDKNITSAISECNELLSEKTKPASIYIDLETMEKIAGIADFLKEKLKVKLSASKLLDMKLYEYMTASMNEELNINIDLDIKKRNFESESETFEVKRKLFTTHKNGTLTQTQINFNSKVFKLLHKIYLEYTDDMIAIDSYSAYVRRCITQSVNKEFEKLNITFKAS